METGAYVFRSGKYIGYPVKDFINLTANDRNGIPHDAYDSRTQMTRTDIGLLSSVQY